MSELPLSRSARSKRAHVGDPQSPLAGAESTRLASVIEHLPIGDLKPYERNARKHDARQVLKLRDIIRRVGFLVPIIVDQANLIIAGHGRWAAAKELRLKHVPAIRVSHLSEAEVRAFRLADNRLSELSDWDDDLKAKELRDLAAVDLDFDILDLTGFEIAEIDIAIASLEGGSSNTDKADEILVDTGPALSRVGDLFQLGHHRLICGSSLDPASYASLLGGELVRACFADPPYNVPIAGHVSGLGAVKHREFVQASGEMSEEAFIGFLTEYLSLTRQHSQPGALHYACMDAAHGFELLTAGRRAGLAFKTTCTWAKTNAGMGSLYRQQTEFVHVFKNGDAKVAHINTVQLGRFGRNRTTLWTYAGVNTFRKGRMGDLADHPTVKPWALVADAIKDCTRRGEGVLDAFCGSGTTLIAAEKTGRVGYGVELDPLYVDVAIRRWEALTGGQARHVQTGLTLLELADARAQRCAKPVEAPVAADAVNGGDVG